MKTVLVNDPLWPERYESLRRHFLGEAGRLQSAPLGLLLFMREGWAGWMRSWNQESPVSAPAANRVARMSPSTLTSGWQRELTFLLAPITTVHL